MEVKVRYGRYVSSRTKLGGESSSSSILAAVVVVGMEGKVSK